MGDTRDKAKKKKQPDAKKKGKEAAKSETKPAAGVTSKLGPLPGSKK